LKDLGFLKGATVRESPFYFETHISHFESIGAGFFMAIIGSDKHSKRYFSRRFRSSPPGNWRLGPLVATSGPPGHGCAAQVSAGSGSFA
jgi:hypothetical protein